MASALLLFCCLSLLSFCSALSDHILCYLVHLRVPLQPQPTKHSLQEVCHSFLPQTASGEADLSRLVHSYNAVFTGFSAKLSPREVTELAKRQEILFSCFGDLNYPTFSVQLGQYSVSFPRTVTNVGEASSTYAAHIQAIPGVDVYVDPDTLIFTGADQKLSYSVQFARRSDAQGVGFQGNMKLGVLFMSNSSN